MKRLFGALLLVATSFAPSLSTAQETNAPSKACALDGVRAFIADAGDTSIVEVSARVKMTDATTGTCKVDWSLIALSSPDGSASAPTIAIVSTFVDHRLVAPLVLADGVSTAAPRELKAEVAAGGTVFSVRLHVEGTMSGLHVEIPRHTFPKNTIPGARFERRVKSAREGSGKFGALGDIAIAPTGPGAAGGIGPSGPVADERVVLEMIPKSSDLTPLVPLPNWAITLDALRARLPLRALELSTTNEEGWNELARRAYAAALHGDPVVATLGMHTLAWLAGGLSLDTVTIAKTPSVASVAVVPAAVADGVGDPQSRLQKRYGTATGHLLPLGRPSTFRKALAARPWLENARASSAREAVARLATFGVADLTPYLVPPIMDGTAPVDPPPPVAPIQVAPLTKPGEVVPTDPGTAPPTTAPARRHVRRKAMWKRPRTRVIAGFAAFAVVALVIVSVWRRSIARPRDDASFDRRGAF